MTKDTQAISSNKPVKNTWQKIIRFELLAITCGLFVLGTLQLTQRHIAVTGQASLPSYSTVVTEDVAEPEESKPKEDTYTVPADQPRSIILNTIGASGLIQKIGLNKDNAISVPNNVYYAGWYTDSVRPGEEGLSIIDGHVSGRYVDGIFKNLVKLKVGDMYSVEYGDKSTRNFEVVEVKTLPEAESAEFLLKKRTDISKQLNLITCGGKFIQATQTYEDRVIVVSKATN